MADVRFLAAFDGGVERVGKGGVLGPCEDDINSLLGGGFQILRMKGYIGNDTVDHSFFSFLVSNGGNLGQ
jgi:hypothetical protein